MTANSSGFFTHCLARETGRIGHLYSPKEQKGPWPWLPYALDNGAFACWDKASNTFDHAKWASVEHLWFELIDWAELNKQKPLWGIVPDVVGDAEKTFQKWDKFNHYLTERKIPLALAAQDGMTPKDVKALKVQPDILAIGGSDEFKWGTLEEWVANFPRVHVLRCNMPRRLIPLEAMGVVSIDGTGWDRGDAKQTFGLEKWARSRAQASTHWLTKGKIKKARICPQAVIEQKTRAQKALLGDLY